MIVEIIAIGTEVVDGTVVNTNAAWLASQLSERGYEVKFHTAIPDEDALILQALERASQRAQIVLVTGGLGPTVDDFTLEIAAKFFNTPLVQDAPSLARIRNFFKQLGRTLTANQEKQALLPSGGIPLANQVGTAPGVHCVQKGVSFAFFPGVPSEMQKMFLEEWIPLVGKFSIKEVIAHKVLRCFGLPEGQVDAELKPLLQGRGTLRGAEVGFRVRFPTIDIRLRAVDADPLSAQAKVDQASQAILEKLGDCVFGEGEDSLEEAVGRLLKEQGLTLATAESCTGGLLASLITDVPGASDYFLEGVVTYSNEAKIKILGVQKKTLEIFGAVSSETALEMAHGLKKISGADFCISITGIAGPSGGSEEKPVGTVHIAVVHPEGEWEKEFHFPLGRLRFKQLAAATALDRVRRILLKL